MTTRSSSDDRLDEVLAELEAARGEPVAVPTDESAPRRLIRPPESLGTGRWVPSRHVVVLVVLCALLAGGIFVVRILLSSAGEARSRTPGPSRVAVAGSPTSAVGSAAGATPKKSSARWSIHVVGAVRHPGVVTVPADSRVADAVAAAGGMAQGADASGVNLARQLTDGEQVHIPRPGEKWTPPADSAPKGAEPGGPSASSAEGSPGGAPGKVGGAVVNLNSAGLEQLDSLPGVGPVMAQRILDWRQEHGKFSSVDELGEVSGIGEKTLARLKPKVTV